jgi:phosphate:Na+ symporter
VIIFFYLQDELLGILTGILPRCARQDELKSGDTTMVTRILTIEEEIDTLEKEYKHNHIDRLKKKICNPEADTIFVESLRNLERISDHAYNIALTLIY